MQKRSRTYNSIANSIYGILASFVTVVLNFAVRVVLVRQLGEEINGINSLFQNIINMMALMEMGISSAMIIHLYEPVKNDNHGTIAGIMAFYRHIYYYVAAAFSSVGILIALFFINSLVTSSISLNKVRLYFIIFTSVFSLNYLTFYKRSILYAEQNNRVSTLATMSTEILFRSLQIVSMLLFQSYIVFLLLLMLEKIASNFICIYFVNKKYPYLRNNHAIISSEKKQAIISTVKPLMVNQTATTVQGASSSLLISILLGNVSVVGYYGVYQLVIGVVNMLFSQLGGAFTTSFGNLAVENDYLRMQRVYKNTAFIMNWIACICSAIFFLCVDDFIYYVFGRNFVLSPISVTILTLGMIITLFNIPVISIQNSMGLHRYDATAMVFQALLAVVLGYVFGKMWGMEGILLGAIVPTLWISTFKKGVIISKIALSMRFEEYARFITYEMFKMFFAVMVVYVVKLQMPLSCSMIGIFVKAIIAIMVAVLVPYMLSLRQVEFIFAKELFAKVILKFKC